MKTIIVYASYAHGNTEKLAQSMAVVLKADLVGMDKAEPWQLAEYDLVGFGSGIYHFGFHKKIIHLADELGKFAKPDIFVFSTSGVGKPSLNLPFTRHLTDRGFPVVASFACKGFDNYGIKRFFGGIAQDHPNAFDLQNAQTFATNLQQPGTQAWRQSIKIPA